MRPLVTALLISFLLSIAALCQAAPAARSAAASQQAHFDPAAPAMLPHMRAAEAQRRRAHVWGSSSARLARRAGGGIPNLALSQSLQNANQRIIVWDEENRARSMTDGGPGGGQTVTFKYDEAGQRTLKRSSFGETAYVNQFFVVRNHTVATKHIFAGETRLTSKLNPGNPVSLTLEAGIALSGGNKAPVLQDPFSKVVAQWHMRQTGRQSGATAQRGSATAQRNGAAGKAALVGASADEPPSADADEPPSRARPQLTTPALVKLADHLQPAPAPTPSLNGPAIPIAAGGNGNGQANGNPPATSAMPTGSPEDNFIFFYHPDHLGSTAHVTDRNGALYQHVAYFAFGETWIEQATNSEQVPYLFSGKELDQETGLYYFGARYYDPKTSVWQSVDPALEAFLEPSRSTSVLLPKTLSVYAYAFNQPLNLRDPDGREPMGIGAHEAAKSAIAANVSGDDVTRSDIRAMQSAEVKGAAMTSLIVVGALASEGLAAKIAVETQAALANVVAALTESAALPTLAPAAAGAGAASQTPAGRGLIGKLTGLADDAVGAAGKALQSFTTGGGNPAAGGTHGHHSYPKYLGGPVKQALVRLPKELHQKYHAGLDKVLPRQKGKAFYETLGPTERAQAMQDLSDFTKAFDAKHGTDLYRSMTENGFKPQ